MANQDMYECIIVIGEGTSRSTFSWIISLLDYDKVKAVTIFDFEHNTVVLHEAGGEHPLAELEERVKKSDRDLMVVLLYNYLIVFRPGIYEKIFPGEPLPQVAFISISSHSFMTGLSPRFDTPDGVCSLTSDLTGSDFLANHRDQDRKFLPKYRDAVREIFSENRDKIREVLSPDCVVKLWGCEGGIAGNDLPERTTRACLQLDWDEKPGNKDFFNPKLYTPSLEHPTFYQIYKQNREGIKESLREEFDYLTARNIIKYIFLGDNPVMDVPEVIDSEGAVVEKREKNVVAGYMKIHSFYPAALSLFLNRPVIASRFGVSAEKSDINPEKLSLLGEIRDRNRARAFPGLDEYFGNAVGEITMPVKVECEVLDLLISCWATPPESIQVPSVLLSMDFPSERYVVYRPDIRYSLSNVEYPGRSATLEKPSILNYHGTDEDILKTGHLLTYPGIDDY
jgi:hypothetical protein